MAVTDDRKYSKEFIYQLLESIKGKTLGEVDSSHQFARTQRSSKITGIAGDVIEQSVFGYARDSRQECDIEIDGVLTELKATGVRVPKTDLPKASGKVGADYNVYLGAKEGISITGVTFEPTYQTDFETSHFWEKAERLLMIFYEYRSYHVVPAAEYADFPIVDYCYNTFSDSEKRQLRNDWELVRDYLRPIYAAYPRPEERNAHLEGFTHRLRPQLLLIELVPGFKKKLTSGHMSYQRPRYRLKQTFVDYIVRGHFRKDREATEIPLATPFTGFAELEARLHALGLRYGGMTLARLQQELGIEAAMTTKDFTALCVLRMFGAASKRLNQIADFVKAGIIAKTITITPTGGRTEDMKLQHVDFEEWADRDVDFVESAAYAYFSEHSFLCPIFCERGDMRPRRPGETTEAFRDRIAQATAQTTFEGFKRFSFDEEFMEQEVRRTWEDSRRLIHQGLLAWQYEVDASGRPRVNASGSYMGAPNLPKSQDYKVFFRGGANDSSDEARTETVNGVRMLPQYFWLKGAYVAQKLQSLPYL